LAEIEIQQIDTWTATVAVDNFSFMASTDPKSRLMAA
jgi:hypothetical protein